MYSKADLHIHTTYSDGLMSPAETVELIAAETDLRVIAITDHDTAEGAFAARDYALRRRLPIEVVIGQECTTPEGDVIGLFLKSSLPLFKTAAMAIKAIHAQGGLAVAAHPFCGWATFNKMHGLGAQVFTLPLDAIEAHNGFPVNLVSNPLARWLNRRRGQNLPELGGSDSHVPFTAGQGFTWFPGQTADDLRWAIESGAVRAAGPLWTPLSLARMVPLLLRKGLPNYKPVYAE